MLDFDLAELYDTTTKSFNQAVRRNMDRFPDDFLFQLSEQEWQIVQNNLIHNSHSFYLNRSQIVTGSQKHRNKGLLPYAFTEQGVAMLSGVLHSPKAIKMNIHIIRAFVEIRRFVEQSPGRNGRHTRELGIKNEKPLLFFIFKYCKCFTMRYLSLLLLSIILTITSHSQNIPSAEQVLKEATQTAAKENKKVFIIFHASWCGWCHKMDTSMNDKSVKAFFDNNYVIRHLTVLESEGKKNLENPGADDLMAKYNGKGQGIPFWLIFDKNGKLLFDSKRRVEGQGPEASDNVGCPANEKEVDYFVKVLKQTSKLTDQQLEIIYRLFRKNDR